MAFDDKKKDSLARKLGRLTRKSISNVVDNTRAAGTAIAAPYKAAGQYTSEAVSDFAEGFSGQSAKTQQGASTQRSQGDNAAQLNTGTQDASGVGALSNTPERPSQAPGASNVSLGTLIADRDDSPGQQGSQLGAYTPDGMGLTSGGGTVSTVGPQQDTTGRDRAFAQLEALRRIRGSTGGTPSNLNADQGPSNYMMEVQARNERVRQNQALGDIDRAVRRGAMSARAGEAAKAKLIGEQNEVGIAQAKLAQDATQFGVTSSQKDRALTLQDRELTLKRESEAARLAQAGQDESRRRAEADRKFTLDVAKFGLDEAKARESERSNRLGEELDFVQENRRQYETQLEQQRANTGRVAEVGKFLKGRREGTYTDIEAIMGISRLGDNPLDFFSPEEYDVGSPERQTLLNLEAEMLEKEKQKLGN